MGSYRSLQDLIDELKLPLDSEKQLVTLVARRLAKPVDNFYIVEAPAEYLFYLMYAINMVPWDGASISDKVREERRRVLHSCLNQKSLRQLRRRMTLIRSPYFKGRNIDLITLRTSLSIGGFGPEIEEMEAFKQSELHMCVHAAGIALCRRFAIRTIVIARANRERRLRLTPTELKSPGKEDQKRALKAFLDANWLDIPDVAKQFYHRRHHLLKWYLWLKKSKEARHEARHESVSSEARRNNRIYSNPLISRASYLENLLYTQIRKFNRNLYSKRRRQRNRIHYERVCQRERFPGLPRHKEKITTATCDEETKPECKKPWLQLDWMVERLKIGCHKGNENREFAARLHPPHLRIEQVFEINPLHGKYPLVTFQSLPKVKHWAKGRLGRYDGPEESNLKYGETEEKTLEEAELDRLRDKCEWDKDTSISTAAQNKSQKQQREEDQRARENDPKWKGKGKAYE